MKNRVLKSVLIASLVLAPLSGVTTVFAEDVSSQTEETSELITESLDSDILTTDSFIPLEGSIEESQDFSEDVLFEEELPREDENIESLNETEEAYEEVFYNGQWFQFPIQEEPTEVREIDPNENHELGTFTKPLERGVMDVISETQKGRPKWDFIDVASYQSDLSVADYEFMKKHGVTGVVVKLTEGTYYKNPYAEGQIKNALAAGLKVSTYHFSRFLSKKSAEDEAAFYAKEAKRLGLPSSTVMVNDIETDFNAYSSQNSVYFANKLKELGYGTTLHYSSAYIFDKGTLSTAMLGAKNLWVAQYPYKPTDKNILHESRNSWQWSSTMEFSAIKGKRFDVSMDHSGTLSNSLKGDENLGEDEDVIPSPIKETTINKYGTVIKKGYSFWNDFAFRGEKSRSDSYFQKTVYVEKEYVFSDGTTLVSLKDNKKNFLGYADSQVLEYAKNQGGIYISDGRFVTVHTQNYDLWQNFAFSKSKAKSGQYRNQTLQARGRYNHFNGSTYYSLYSNNGTWLGYINANGVKEATGRQGIYQSYGKYVTVTTPGGYPMWRNFAWSSKTPGSFKGKTYLAKGVYQHFNGSRYLSLYDNQGKWIGYINEKGTRIGNGKQGIYQSYGKYVTVTTPGGYPMWRNFSWTKKASGNFRYKRYLAKGVYQHVNGSRYLSLYENDKWIGYMNEKGTK